jgi:hypothetical protein
MIEAVESIAVVVIAVVIITAMSSSFIGKCSGFIF